MGPQSLRAQEVPGRAKYARRPDGFIPSQRQQVQYLTAGPVFVAPTSRAFATAALALRFGEGLDGQANAPIMVEQLTEGPRTCAKVYFWARFQTALSSLPGRIAIM
jgi:hypothetical protein